MSRRRVSMGAAVAALLVVVVVLPFTTTAVGAASVSATGWWWRVQAGPSPVLPPPPPPVVAEGGLVVEGAPPGPVAVAATRITLSPGEVADTLTLQVADSINLNGAVILACPAARAWEPAAAGVWERRPEPDCTRGSSVGTASADAKTVTFPLAGVTGAGAGDNEIDLVIFPGAVGGLPAQANTSPFRVVFTKPDARAVTTNYSGSGSAGFGSFGSDDDSSFTDDSFTPSAFDATADTAFETSFGATDHAAGVAAYAPPVERPAPSPYTAAPVTAARPAAGPPLTGLEKAIVAVAIAAAAAGLFVLVRHEVAPTQLRPTRR